MEGMLMLLVMMVITVVLAWVLNGKQRKRAISLLLCAALMSSYIPAINVAKADSAAKPVLADEQVLVNGVKTAQIGAVTYSASESAYTIDTSSARVRVKNGDSISFEGAISAPEGETISWVRVDVYDASTEEPYTVGAEYYRADGLKVQQYDLSNIPALTIGEAFGRKGYTLAEGGKYIVMFCVGDSNGNTFADMDAVIEDNQGPAILVDVKLSPSNCKHPHSDYVYILHSSGEVRKQSYGDSMTHQVEPLYERYCGLCDTFLMNIWGEGTSEEHSMDSNGVCLGCGYCVEPMMPLTYAARISSLEFTSPNDGDEVQVGEFVTVEWEKKDGTEEYVVYVKLLDGEPDNGSDNEIGTLLDNQQNWKYTEYTMVIPENAAGKWIKFNVHGKTSAGEQTEAASSLYIYVRSDEYEEDPTTCTHEYSEDVIDKECYDRGNYAFHWYCEEIEYYCSKCGDTYTEWTTEDDQVYEEHTWNSENSTCIDCECVLPKLTMDYFTIEDNYKVGDVFSFAGEINGNESNISRVSINVKKPSADSEVHLSTVDVNSFTYNLWDVADIELDEAGEYGIFIWAVDAAGNGLNSDDAEAGTGTFVYWFTVDEPLPPTMTEDLSVSPKVVMQGESVSISGMVAGTEGSKLKNIQVSVFDHDDPQKGGIVYREENLTDTYWYNLNEIQIDTDAVYGNLEMGIGVYDVVLYVTDEYGLGLEDTPMVTFEVIAQEENALYIDSHQELTEVNVGEYYTISWSNGNSYAYVAETVVLDGEPAYNENEAGTSSGTIRLDDDSFSGVIDSNQAGKYLKIIIYGVDESGSVSQDADYVYFYVNPVESGSPIIENLVIDESVPEGGSIYVGGTVKGIGAALTDVAIAIRSAEDETMGGYLAQYGSFYTDSFELGYAYQTGVTVGNLFLGEGEYIVEVYATDENGNGFAERQYGNLTITPHDPTYGVSILSHNYYGQIEENEEVTVSWLDGYSDRYVVNVMYLDGDPTAGDPDTGTSVATNVIVEGGSYTFTAPDVDAEDKWVKFSVYGIQSDSMDVMEYESTVYLRTVPAASKPTIENFAASETEVSVGDTISLSGVINGNGTQLRAVQVSVFEHDNHVNGVVFYHSGSIFMDEFDLSAVEEIPVGEPVGETDFVLTEGQYDIVLYATNADGNGFESDPTITVTVVEREKASVNVEIEEDSVFVGDSISLNGEASGGDYYLKKVQVSVFTDDSGTCGYYDVSKEFAQGEAKTFDLSELGEIAIRESFTCNAHGVEEKFPAGEAKITVYMSVYDGEGASASDYVTVEEATIDKTSPWLENPVLVNDTVSINGMIKLEGKALDDAELKGIYLYIDGIDTEAYVHMYEPAEGKEYDLSDWSIYLSEDGWDEGYYSVKLDAEDSEGNFLENGPVLLGYLTITGEEISPVIDPITCTVASPFTAGTEVTFSTKAADDVNLAKIELFIDGELKKTETVSGLSGTISYTTSALAIGDHTVMVVATDASGLTNNISLTVTVQKADSSTCPHLNTTVIPDPQCVKVDEQMHQWIYTYWTHCLDCKTGLSNVQDEDLPEKHTWKDGACEKCKHVCSHNFELVVNEKGENVAVENSGRWQKYDEDYHVCIEIKYYTKCAECGEVGESEYYPAGWKKEHTYGEIKPESYEIDQGGHYVVGTHECTLMDCGHIEPTKGKLESHTFKAVIKQEAEPWGNRHSIFITTEYYCVCGKKDGGYSFDERVENHIDANNDDICDVCKGYAYLNNEFESFNPRNENTGYIQNEKNYDYFGVNLLTNEKYSPIVKVNKELSAEDWTVLFNEHAFNDAPGYLANIFAEYLQDNAEEWMNDSREYPEDLARPDDITEGVVIDVCKERMRKNIATILGQENSAEKLFAELKNLLPETEQEMAEYAGGELADEFIGDGASWIELDDIKRLAVMLTSVSEEYVENLELLKTYRDAVENSRDEVVDAYSKKAVLKAIRQLELEYSAIYKNAREWSITLMEKPFSIGLGVLTAEIFTFMGFVVSDQEYEKYMAIYADAAIEMCIMDGGMREFEITVMNEGHIKPGEYREYTDNAEYVYVSRIRQCIEYGGMEKEIEDLKRGLEYILREKNLSEKEIKDYIKRVVE